MLMSPDWPHPGFIDYKKEKLPHRVRCLVAVELAILTLDYYGVYVHANEVHDSAKLILRWVFDPTPDNHNRMTGYGIEQYGKWKSEATRRMAEEANDFSKIGVEAQLDNFYNVTNALDAKTRLAARRKAVVIWNRAGNYTVKGMRVGRLPFDPQWRTSTAVSVAKGVLATGDYSAMPILADALQDAGCTHDSILLHLQETGNHVRTDWVLWNLADLGA